LEVDIAQLHVLGKRHDWHERLAVLDENRFLAGFMVIDRGNLDNKPCDGYDFHKALTDNAYQQLISGPSVGWNLGGVTLASLVRKELASWSRICSTQLGTAGTSIGVSIMSL
jgi:hypothetical protein